MTDPHPSQLPSPSDPTLRGAPDQTAELSGDGGDLLERLPVEVPGSRIGPYRLVRQIGEGGFGSVFLAEQEVPVKRSVAIKVVKLGMDTRQVVARFEQERQTLALMEHPNIARVLDAGATESGRPYFVMELVKGEPIVAYCDRNALSVRQRVELVVEVCLAVQHAHTKGILHRDIKPSNILIAIQDGRPTVKVIDFGIAKATGGGAFPFEAITEQRQLIGTPEYMSPEQAEGSLDIDTRTDVYSIGVLLYELITGTTPFSTSELRAAAIGELQRIIREVDPPSPSTRLSRAGETITGIASRRRTEPTTLGASVRGELDWIVMKALEKDRTRRYASASELAEDIRRHLSGEAVLAAPPSRVYRVRKFASRHRVGVAATSCIAATIVVGAAAFAWQAQVAREQRDRAIAAETEQRERALELKTVAEFQSKMLSGIDVASAGSRLMQSMRQHFDESLATDALPESDRVERLRSFERDLARINGTDEAGALIRTTVLLPAIAAVDNEFGGQPLVDAALRHTLARVLFALGWAEDALPLARRAHEIRRSTLGENARETLASLESVASIVEALGQIEEATNLYRTVHDARLAAFGDGDAETLTAMGNLGNAYRTQGKLDLAEPLLVGALAGQRRVIGDDAKGTLIAANTLGYLHMMRGDLGKARPLWTEAYETGRRVYGEDDSDVIVWTYNLAGLLQGMGELVEAEGLYRTVLEKYTRLLGRTHPTTTTVLGGLSVNLIQQFRFADAEPLAREVLDASLATFGPEHSTTLFAMSSLGSLLTRMERSADAEPILREALVLWRRTAGDDRPETINARELLARALIGNGSFEEAIQLYVETAAIARRALGPEHPQTLSLLTNLGNAFLSLRRPSEAEPVLDEALAARKRVSGDDHRETILTVSNVGILRQQQGRLAEAEALQRDALARFQRILGNDHIHTLNASVHLATVLRASGHPAEAERILRERRPAVEAKTGADSRTMAVLRQALGESLRDLGRFAEAAAELTPAVERLLRSPAIAPAVRLESARAMVTLYEEWQRAEPSDERAALARMWDERRKELEASQSK